MSFRLNPLRLIMMVILVGITLCGAVQMQTVQAAPANQAQTKPQSNAQDKASKPDQSNQRIWDIATIAALVGLALLALSVAPPRPYQRLQQGNGALRSRARDRKQFDGSSAGFYVGSSAPPAGQDTFTGGGGDFGGGGASGDF